MRAKPDDIPQDIWDAAINLPGARVDNYGEIIARAILAERERCARLADEYDGDGLDGGYDCQLGDARHTLRDIVKAIRAGDQP